MVNCEHWGATCQVQKRLPNILLFHLTSLAPTPLTPILFPYIFHHYILHHWFFKDSLRIFYRIFHTRIMHLAIYINFFWKILTMFFKIFHTCILHPNMCTSPNPSPTKIKSFQPQLFACCWQVNGLVVFRYNNSTSIYNHSQPYLASGSYLQQYLSPTRVFKNLVNFFQRKNSSIANFRRIKQPPRSNQVLKVKNKGS